MNIFGKLPEAISNGSLIIQINTAQTIYLPDAANLNKYVVWTSISAMRPRTVLFCAPRYPALSKLALFGLWNRDTLILRKVFPISKYFFERCMFRTFLFLCSTNKCKMWNISVFISFSFFKSAWKKQGLMFHSFRSLWSKPFPLRYSNQCIGGNMTKESYL